MFLFTPIVQLLLITVNREGEVNKWKMEGGRKVCNIPKLGGGIKESYEWLKQGPDTELKLRGYKTLIEQGKSPV